MAKQQTKFDLEERTTEFARSVIRYCKTIRGTTISRPLIGQVVRASSSIGANYREANDALGKKDFVLRLRIARKEAKETIHFLELLSETDSSSNKLVPDILQEVEEIRNILSSIIRKCS